MLVLLLTVDGMTALRQETSLKPDSVIDTHRAFLIGRNADVVACHPELTLTGILPHQRYRRFTHLSLAMPVKLMDYL